MAAGSYALSAIIAKLAGRVHTCSPDQEATVLDTIRQLLDWMDQREGDL